LLRSQDGVEDVENAYGNLKQGLIKIKVRKDKAIDLGRLVQILEKEAGFEPITEVRIELRGRLARRDGKLVFETSGTGQTFTMAGAEGKDGAPPEKKLLAAFATLEDPRAPDRIRLREWKVEREAETRP
jgi:hypothetical protein